MVNRYKLLDYAFLEGAMSSIIDTLTLLLRLLQLFYLISILGIQVLLPHY